MGKSGRGLPLRFAKQGQSHSKCPHDRAEVEMHLWQSKANKHVSSKINMKGYNKNDKENRSKGKIEQQQPRRRKKSEELQ